MHPFQGCSGGWAVTEPLDTAALGPKWAQMLSSLGFSCPFKPGSTFCKRAASSYIVLAQRNNAEIRLAVFHPSIYPSTHPCIRSSTHPSTHPSNHAFQSIHLPGHLFIHLSIFPFISSPTRLFPQQTALPPIMHHPPNHPSISSPISPHFCLSVCSSICPAIHPSFRPPIHLVISQVFILPGAELGMGRDRKENYLVPYPLKLISNGGQWQAGTNK